MGLVLGLVVMLIVLVVLFQGFGGKSYMQNVAQTRKTAVKTVEQINTDQLDQCVVAYKLANNRLPQTPEELDAGPSLRDQWGHEMTFTYKTSKEEGREEATTVVWRSAGPDGVMNNEDDVVKEDRLGI